MKTASTENLLSIDKDRIDEVVSFVHNGNDEIIETGDFIMGIRAALLFLDNLGKTRKLTPTENYCVNDVVGRVVDSMSFDHSSGKYEDGGNFIYACSKADFAALKRALKKL